MEIDFERLRVACKYKSECGYHCYAEGNYAKPCLQEKNCPLRQEPPTTDEKQYNPPNQCQLFNERRLNVHKS